MENYTKYALKAAEELKAVLASTDNIFVVACNKCFKEFASTQEPDCQAFLDIAEEMGKTVTGTAKADFLCNKVKAESGLGNMIPEGTECVFVIGCGLGVKQLLTC